MTTVAILPIKEFSAAKSRLADAIGLGHRRALAEAMYSDVLTAVRRTAAIDQIIVVTRDTTAAQIAGGHGITVVDDQGQSHSESAAQGVAAAIAQGASRVLLVAADCPLLRPRDLEQLLAHSSNSVPRALIVPDRHGTGTNALVLSPPDALTPAFGEGSCERHSKLATEQGATPEVVQVPALALDIDTPEDLLELREQLNQVVGGAAHTRGLFAQLQRSSL